MRFKNKNTLTLLVACALAACGRSGGSLVPPVQGDAVAAPAPIAVGQGTRVEHAASTTSAPVSLTGTVQGVYSGGFTLYASGCGNVHVATTSSTQMSSTPSKGQQVAVKGSGSCSTSVVASVVTTGGGGSGSATAHLLTEDYLGKPYGTTSISWSQAAPYLSWAQTAPSYSAAIAAAGIKTQLYSNPNRTSAGDGDPLYNSNEATFAHDCNGHRVTDVYAHSVTQYVMNVGGSAMQTLFANYVRSMMASGHYDSVFEDGAGTLTADAPYTPFSAMPCGYSDASWLSAQESLDQAVPIPVYINGLDALYNGGPSQALQVLNSSNTAGGDFEGCYTDNSTALYAGWVWAAVENSEIQVNEKYRRFLCQERNGASASSSIGPRIYALASFLLTYNPTTSILWEEFSTPSGFHVEPESKLVALQPKIATPSSITGLKLSGGTYGREYEQCTLGGSSVGSCAVVVNSDSASHPFPYSSYHHTLVLSGGGILDGGTVSSGGGAPPSTMAAKTAVIAFP